MKKILAEENRENEKGEKKLSRFTEGLNEMQKKAVECTDGPLLVLAGAGSGKTRVLTHRIAHIIETKDIRPAEIMALTFTNKAAKEMKDRIAHLINNSLDAMWVGTFHSICVRILRRDIEKLGYSSNFVIYDTQDQKTLIKDCLKELDLSEKTYEVNMLLGFIGRQKDQLLTPKESIAQNFKDFRERTKAEIYQLYQKKLKANNALDFDDIIVNTVTLFRDFPLVLTYYQDRFKYLMVDEYQDTNRAQYVLVNQLAKKSRNLCVVGDDDQSIYGWRGADIRNILDFEKDYSEAVVIKLEQNYRSTQNILSAANEVIQHNTGRKSKKLWTDNDEGTKINLYRANNDIEETLFAVGKIKKYAEEEKYKYSDMAILYRTNAQSRTFEETLIKASIPYKIVGGLKFYDRKEIKDIIAYMRVSQNPHDDISLKRIINVPKRGIGATTLDKVEQYSMTNDQSLFETLLTIDELNIVNRPTAEKLSKFATLIAKFMAMKEVIGIDELFENIIDQTGYLKSLKEENTIESQGRIDNIEEFKSVIAEFISKNEETSLDDFLADVSLLSDLDKTDDVANSVTLMTIHSSKGLEFPVVFLVGMEDSVFPLSRAMNTQEEMEEERRLCYVAITRAMTELFISHAEIRMLYGRSTCNPPSRFLKEIPLNLFGETEEKSKSTGLASSGARTSAGGKSVNAYFKGSFFKSNSQTIPASESTELAQWKAGDKVKHKVFGVGTIVQIKGEGQSLEANVAFENNGIKKLMLALAPVEKL